MVKENFDSLNLQKVYCMIKKLLILGCFLSIGNAALIEAQESYTDFTQIEESNQKSDQEKIDDPMGIGALNSVQFALRPHLALGYNADTPENTLFLKYGPRGSQSYDEAHFPYYTGFMLGALCQATIGWFLAHQLYHIGMSADETAKSITDSGHASSVKIPAFVLRYITTILAAYLGNKAYDAKIDPQYYGYYHKDIQVSSETLPISFVPMGLGYLVANMLLSFKQNAAQGSLFNNKLSLGFESVFAAWSALIFYFYTESGPNVDRSSQQVLYHDTDLTEAMLGAAWFWLLMTPNALATTFFNKITPSKVGEITSIDLRTILATLSVLIGSAYSGFDMGDMTAATAGALIAWGLHTKNPKITVALAGLIAVWSTLGIAANSLVWGYSQTSTIN